MADIIKEQTGSETLEQKQSYEDLMKQLSELEKQIGGDGIIGNGESILDEEYNEKLRLDHKMEEKIKIIKVLICSFSDLEGKKHENEIYKNEENIRNTLSNKFPNHKDEIKTYLSARANMNEILHENEGSINFDLNESFLGIIDRGTSLNESTEIINQTINYFHSTEIKKIIKEYSLTENEVNSFIGKDGNLSKFSFKDSENGNFYFGDRIKNHPENLQILKDDLRDYTIKSKLNESLISKKRNFSEIINKNTDPYTMGLEIKANLEKEILDKNGTETSKETILNKNLIRDSYFKDLTEFLLDDKNALKRQIFLEKSELTNENDKSAGFLDGLKRGLSECDYTKELLGKLRVKEMQSKAALMLDKAKELYNDEGLKKLKSRIFEKIEKDGKECVLDYLEFFKTFDQDAIKNGWINLEKHPKDKYGKPKALGNKEIGEMLIGILKAEANKEAAELVVILLKKDIKPDDIEKFQTKKELEDFLKSKNFSNEEVQKIIHLNNKLHKTNSQIQVMTKFNSLSSENQTKFLSDFENAKKEGKEPSEAIKILDTYVQKNSEEIKQNILKFYPEAIISHSSNGGAEIKVGNTIMDLNSKELSIIGGNKEKLGKFIEFKSSLDDLGLGFLWKDREILFQNIKNLKGENSINMLDDNVVGEQEFKNILDYIAGKLDIPKTENLDDFKNEFKNYLKSDFLKINGKEYKSSGIGNVFETALTGYVDGEEGKLIINGTFKKD